MSSCKVNNVPSGEAEEPWAHSEMMLGERKFLFIEYILLQEGYDRVNESDV